MATLNPTRPGVAVIIITRNRYEDLALLLQSIRRQEYPNIEVTVIDNHSGDGSVAKLVREFPEVAIYEAVRNVGLCVAQNAGVRFTHGDYLWFLNDDTEVLSPNYASRIVGMFEADRRLGAVGGEAVIDDAGQIVGVINVAMAINGLGRGGFLLDAPEGELVEAQILCGASIFTRREIIESIKGFDPFYFIYWDDFDISYRITLQGYRNAVIGKSPVVHRYSTSNRIKGTSLQSRNRIYFVLKNFPLWKVLMLPLSDLLVVFNPFHNVPRIIKRASQIELGPRAYIQAVSKDADSNISAKSIFYTLVQAVQHLGMVFGGYFRILPHLPTALRMRRQQPDFLAETDLSQFTDRRTWPDRLVGKAPLRGSTTL